LDLYKGSKFLNNKCSVQKISIDENGYGSAEIKCSGTKGTITLSRSEKKEGGKGLVEEKLDNDKEFYEVINAYKEVAESYPSEGEGKYGKEALEKAIKFVDENAPGKKQVTEAELLEMYIRLYSNSESIEYYESRLRMLYEVDTSLSGEVIELDNRYRTIRLVELDRADEKSKVKVRVGSEGAKNYSDGDVIYGKGGDNQISITEIEANQIRLGHNCKDSEKVLLEGESKEICGIAVRVDEIDFKGAAKINLIPKAKGTQTETNLTINIGIEKRAIKLSPDKTEELIENLGESLEKWEKISENLGNFVKGLKGACFATAAALTVKNFFEGVDGTALARQQAMQGDNGWSERCRDAVNSKKLDTGKGEPIVVSYGSVTQCINANKDKIEAEINVRAGINEKIENLQADSAGDGVLDREKALENYYNKLKSEYPDTIGKWSAPADGVAPYSMSDLRDMQYALEMKKTGYDVDETIKDINDRVGLNADIIDKYNKDSNVQNVLKLSTPIGEGRVAKVKVLSGTSISESDNKLTLKGAKIDTSGVSLGEFDGASVVSSGASSYLIVGNKNGNDLSPTGVYEIVSDGAKLKNYEGGVDKFMKERGGISRFEDYGDLFGNKIMSSDLKVRYFASGPDKNMPAVVPFDINNGWYVKVESTAGLGDVSGVYKSSGLPNHWEVCNVGANGKMNSDDECQRVDAGYSGDVLGLGSPMSKQVIDKSSKAILDAARQKGQKIITINGEKIYQGTPVSAYDGVECQDFMSADDCLLLFNVCDPVICPATRCNFGGKYYVADVIQSGIIGSTLLCLPNWNEKVKIPVCLTGIQAGIDGYVSILKAHQSCLQESLETGQMVGVCDQIYSIYICEFFWNQVAPVAKQILPSLVERLYSGGTRGGGEYSNWAGAWSNAEKSIDYMTNVYGANSLKAFQARSVEDVGGEFCKAFISVKAPTSFESLIEPDSPPQFHAYFSSSTFTDATVPATAQYKVFYHIFAGKDAGVYYSVYLKDPIESSFYNVPSRVQVSSGFIVRGESKTETKDFTAPEGYKELCVKINNDEKCGFKEVSTSFAVNYLTDEIVGDEASIYGITTEDECVSGSANLGGLVSGNLQEGAEEFLVPDVQSSGIVRICATRNPAESTDPTRYVNVGYCGDKKMICWIDKKSVSSAISDANVGKKKEVLKVLESQQKQSLSDAGKITGDKSAVSEIDDIGARFENNEKKDSLLKSISELYANLVYNHHKAMLLLLRADVLAGSFEVKAAETDGSKVITQDEAEGGMDDEYALELVKDYDEAGGLDVYLLMKDDKPTDIFVLPTTKSHEVFALTEDEGKVNVGEMVFDSSLGKGFRFDLNSKIDGDITDVAKKTLEVLKKEDPVVDLEEREFGETVEGILIFEENSEVEGSSGEESKELVQSEKGYNIMNFNSNIEYLYFGNERVNDIYLSGGANHQVFLKVKDSKLAGDVYQNKIRVDYFTIDFEEHLCLIDEMDYNSIGGMLSGVGEGVESNEGYNIRKFNSNTEYLYFNGAQITDIYFQGGMNNQVFLKIRNSESAGDIYQNKIRVDYFTEDFEEHLCHIDGLNYNEIGGSLS